MNIYRLPQILFLLVMPLTFLSVQAMAQEDNILLIIADDLGVDPMPRYEPSNAIKANLPNIEGLMDDGLLFENVWSNPECSPTRATLLTGKYGFRTDVLNVTTLGKLDSAEQSLHEYIEDGTNGAYSSAIIGKWHLGGRPNNQPDYPSTLGIPYYSGLMSGGASSYDDWTLVTNGSRSNSAEYITTKITDMTIDWIAEQDKPWFAWVAYTAPHTPYHLPPTYMHSQGDLPSDQDSIDANPLPYFLAMTESLDYEIGRLLANIPADELANTTIIFVGDNGTARGVIQRPYRRSQGKSTVYQGGIHVPMVISGARVSRMGEREDGLVNLVDLFPTIANIAGVGDLIENDGQSILPLLTDASAESRPWIYSEYTPSDDSPAVKTAREETYKLIEYTDGSAELYNLINDPYEQDDLYDGSLSAEEQLAYDELQTVFGVLDGSIEPTPIPATSTPVSPIGVTVNCDSEWNLIDVILIKQWNVFMIGAAEICNDETNGNQAIYVPDCDRNGDGNCGLIDAVIIQQCNVFIPNSYCTH